MSWLFLLLAAACLVVAFLTSSLALAVLALLAALGLAIAWLLGTLSARLQHASRDEIQILGPEELRRLRQRAEAAAPNDRTQVSEPDSSRG